MWVRVPRGSNPCKWCKSHEGQTEHWKDINFARHDNCQCAIINTKDSTMDVGVKKGVWKRIDLERFNDLVTDELQKVYNLGGNNNDNKPKIKPASESVTVSRLHFKSDITGGEFIPLNTTIKFVQIIAGDDVSTPFRTADRFAEKYGGVASDYTKKVGQILSDKYYFDIHWIEDKKGRKFKETIKVVKLNKEKRAVK